MAARPAGPLALAHAAGFSGSLVPHSRQQLPGRTPRIELPRCRSVLRDGGKHASTLGRRPRLSGGAGRARLRAAATPHPGPPGPRARRAGGIAALGDSITTGFGSCLVLATCERNSWSTGDGLRVREPLPAAARAQPGTAGRLQPRAAGGPGDGAGRPGRGGGTRPRRLRHRADRRQRRLPGRGRGDDPGGRVPRPRSTGACGCCATGRPKARVLVVSIPDLYRLWEVGHTDARAVRVWRRGICPALLANPTSTAPADGGPPDQRSGSGSTRTTSSWRAACRAYGSRCRLRRRRGAPGALHPGPGQPTGLVPPQRRRPGPAGRGDLALPAGLAG